MVKLFAVITNGREILIKQNALGGGILVCEAPTLLGVKRKFKKELKQILPNLDFYFEKQLFERSVDENNIHILYQCQATAYTYCYSAQGYKWVGLSDIRNINFVDAPDDLIAALKSYYVRISNLHLKLKNQITSAHNQSVVSLEFVESINSLGIFIKTPAFYCTFSFWVLFEYLDDQINYRINWRVNRSFAPGDKSDIYILFLETLAIVIKLFLQEPVFVSMYCNEYGEICDGGLLFEADEHTGVLPESEFIEKVFEMFEVFNLTMGIHGHLIGSISNNSANAPDPSILRCLKTRNTNYVCREEHICYYDDNVECITINNNVYNCDRLLDGYSFDILHGNHGKLLIQKFSSKSFINYIDNDEWQKLQKIVTKRKIRNYQLICQSNKLYLLTQNEIWVINGLFHHALVESEREEILQRNNRERALLLANRSYEWKYPINSGRFEEFAADLLAAVYPDQRIRLMGDSNNADGGRDILIFNPDNTLTICQCKAYQRNVGKHHVTDIRDTLDHYGSSGFFLIVSEGITTHLVDHLCVLKQRYSVDWWTKREMFSLLRQYPRIADSYSDIIKITNTVD